MAAQGVDASSVRALFVERGEGRPSVAARARSRPRATMMRDGVSTSAFNAEEGEPSDPGDSAYWTCVALGAGILLPWNAFITAVDYFGSESMYPDAHVDRLFGVLYFIPNLCALPLVLRFGHVVSPRWRVRVGYFAFLVALVAQALVVGLAPLCLCVALTGVADALAQGSLFGVVAPMPERYTQALMGGTSVAGLVVSLLRLVTKAAFPANDSGLRRSAAAYFIVAAAWVAACLALFGRLERSRVYEYHRARARGVGEDEYESELANLRGAEDARRDAAPRDESRLPSERATLADVRAILREIRPHAFSVACVYAVTLSIFPGVLAEDVASDALGDWYPVALIFVFNAADVAGKALPGRIPSAGEWLGSRPRVLAMMCGARVLFVPAFLATTRAAGVQALSSSEAPCVLLTAALGFTNGWYSSSAMMAAPKVVEKRLAESCGTVMVFFLLSGLATGAVCGWLWLL